MREIATIAVNSSVNSESAEAVDQRPPFTIRAHHLYWYLELVKEDPHQKRVFSPAETARSLRNFAQALLEYPDESLIAYYTAVSHDLIGTSVEDANRYEENNKKIFEQFISLPDDYPAEITDMVPDHMCKACINGKQCESFNFDNFPKEEAIESKDPPMLDAFLKDLNDLNLPEPPVTQKPAHFSDGEAHELQARVAKTTIGIVKKVLKEGKSEF